MSFNLTRAATALATSAQTVAATVQIHHATQIDDRFARIIGIASATATPEQVAAGIKAQFKGAVAIPNSFVSLSSSKAQHVFEGIVGMIAPRIVLTDENRPNYKAVAANMFMDEGEQLWSLRKTATGEVLVRAANEGADMAAMQQLLACASADVNAFDLRGIGAESAEMRATIEGGDVITYVSQQSADLQLGIACASIENEDGSSAHELFVVRPNGQTESVNREMVVASSGYEDSEEDLQEAATASGTMDESRFAAYYARVYARRPAYFDMFMQRVRAHVFM